MTNVFCPMIELGAIIPGVVLAYFPIKKHLKLSKLRLFPVMILSLVCLCTLCGFVCYRYNLKSFVLAIPIVLALSAAYCCSLKTSMWKSVSVLLAVCGVFACIASITRAVDSITFPQNTTPWFEIKSAVLFNILCWMFVILAWYPATHGVSELLDDENIAQTWYVFWILPIIFILLNFFIIPWNPNILHTGRIMQGYIVISVSLLVLLLIFYALLYFIAKSLNRNNKLAQKNQFLNMQRAQYDALKVAIDGMICDITLPYLMLLPSKRTGKNLKNTFRQHRRIFPTQSLYSVKTMLLMRLSDIIIQNTRAMVFRLN